MLERGIFDTMRRTRWQMGCMLGGLVVVAGSSGCEQLLDSPGSAVPEHLIAVDCVNNPDASSVLNVKLPRGLAQVVRLTVEGRGYSQESRVQILGPRSDIRITAPDGRGFEQIIPPSDIADGRVVALRPHGGFLIVQQRAEESTPDTTGIPASPAVAAGNLLAFTLSCGDPAGATATPQPR